jgi:predicted DNA-binding transcriptional regulator AlpA
MRGGRAIPQKEKPVRGKLITMAEASKKIRLSKKWIYNRMENGTLPFPWFMPSPGKRLMDSADIDDWLLIKKIPVGEIHRRQYKRK